MARTPLLDDGMLFVRRLARANKVYRFRLSMCDRSFPTREYTPICLYTSFGGGSPLQERARSPHRGFGTRAEATVLDQLGR